VADLADYLDLTVGQAREQFRALASRRAARGGRQVAFLPAETLLCLAASFLVNHRHFGGSTAHQAPEPVPSLARLFSRPPSSVLAKMANLDGSRSHGARRCPVCPLRPTTHSPVRVKSSGLVEVVNKTGMGWLPAEQLAGQRAQDGAVDHEDQSQGPPLRRGRRQRPSSPPGAPDRG
jgi:hypothetical protein